MKYPFPWREMAGLTRDLVRQRSGSQRVDAETMWRRSGVAPHVEGIEYIPSSGPLLVLANHYQRRGLWIAWEAGAITLAVAERRQGECPAWLVTGGLRWAQWREKGPQVPGTGLLFRRVAEARGLISVPLSSGNSRIVPVRSAMRVLERGGVVGVFPEGLRGRVRVLREPEAGVGKLLRLAGRMGARVVPVGAYEDAGRFCLRFGEPLETEGDPQRVMEAIASLLPAWMRGRFGTDGPLG